MRPPPTRAEPGSVCWRRPLPRSERNRYATEAAMEILIRGCGGSRTRQEKEHDHGTAQATAAEATDMLRL